MLSDPVFASRLKHAFGGHITKKDAEFFFGKAKKSFGRFSSLSSDPGKYGTAAEGTMYGYKKHKMAGHPNLKGTLLLSSQLGLGKVPQDPRYNHGINPATGKAYVAGVYLHAARGAGLGTKTYNNGSEGCSVRYGYFQVYNYLKKSPTGMSGHYLIER